MAEDRIGNAPQCESRTIAGGNGINPLGVSGDRTGIGGLYFKCVAWWQKVKANLIRIFLARINNQYGEKKKYE